MDTRACRQCKMSFDVPNTGRPKQFCSGQCRVKHHRRMNRIKRGLNIPNELVDSPRWVRHIRKRPITASGKAASVTDAKTWCTLAEALDSSVGEGLGFVLGEGIGCVDLDGVIDESGALDPLAEALMDRLPPTWVEISPSGRGIHIWGTLPEGKGSVRNVDGVSVETYSQGRYITVTGDLVGDAPLRLADLSEFVESIS